MKYNSRLNEKVARIAGFADLHPLAPEEESQGALELIYRTAGRSGGDHRACPASRLQPAAGAHGEMTGVMLIRAFLDKRDGEASKDRRVMLIPDSAHGTNPASAASRRIYRQNHPIDRRRLDRSRTICASFATKAASPD